MRRWVLANCNGQAITRGTVILRDKFSQVMMLCYDGETLIGVMVWNGEQWEFRRAA